MLRFVPRMRCRGVIQGLLTIAVCAAPTAAQWPQWGGKHRNFIADADKLADTWPEGGPRKIWTRPIGPGYSSLVVVDERLYAHYRQPAVGTDDAMGPAMGDPPTVEIVIALDAQSGKTIWEYKYPAPMPEGIPADYAQNIVGPNATPLVHDGKVFVFGVTGKLHALDQKSGKPLWSHDVSAEYAAPMPGFGFASSTMIYKDSLILAAGGKGAGVIAFNPNSGEVRWKKHDFVKTHSSPILIQRDGRDEMVLLAGEEVVGMNPANGDIEWRYPFESNVMTPVLGDDGVLFVSSPELGSRGLKLTRKDGAVRVEEVWSNKKLKVGYTTASRSGKWFLASIGEYDEFSMTAIDAATGAVVWEEPGFQMANLVLADDKLIILDQGWLSLDTPTPYGLIRGSKFQLFKKPDWSIPTVVGQRLYARDHESIVALDLSPTAGTPNRTP